MRRHAGGRLASVVRLHASRNAAPGHATVTAA
jgi:hypothetical protein